MGGDGADDPARGDEDERQARAHGEDHRRPAGQGRHAAELDAQPDEKAEPAEREVKDRA